MPGQILFLAHRIPFPPDRGDKIRSHNILRRLAQIAPVHVATFAETRDDLEQECELAQYARSYCIAQRSKPAVGAGIEAVMTGQPVSLTAFQHPEITGFVQSTLAKYPIDAIYVFSGQMGQYVPRDYDGRLICDLVDVDSAKFGAYAKDAIWPMSWIYSREEGLLAAEETRLARVADMTLLVSDQEASLLRGRMGTHRPDTIGTLRNGIDAAIFDPDRVQVLPEMQTGGPHIVFTGQMDYAPNVGASLRIITRLLPAIRQRFPNATFHCVGRDPAPSLLGHYGEPGVRIWGEVPDIRPFLKGADLVLAPLEIARGIQNKVLEAMAMARPVLATSGAATGIDAEQGRDIAIGDSDEELVAAACELLSDTERARSMGEAARRFAIANLSWKAALSGLPTILGFDPSRAKAERRNAA